MSAVRALGPPSTGNVIAGFDTLGAALAPVDGAPWGDVVELEWADAMALTCTGAFASQLPGASDNLVWRAVQAFERQWGQPVPPLRATLEKGLPVGSGLGSSSASIVATLRALDALLGRVLDDDRLLLAAGEAEAHASGGAHLDNVAPALLGGLRLIGEDGVARALPFPDDLRFVVVSPELQLETRVARAALPRNFDFPGTVRHARNLASLVHALHTGDAAALRTCFVDRLAEPHRAALVPGFAAVQRAALDSGAWGCSYSGAGPAMLAVVPASDAAATGVAMVEAWRADGIAAAARTCVLDRRGARVLANPAETA